MSSESIPKRAFIARSEYRVYRIQPRLQNSNQSTKEPSAQQFLIAYRTFFSSYLLCCCCEINSATTPCWFLPQAGRERDPFHLLHELAWSLRKQTFRGGKPKKKKKFNSVTPVFDNLCIALLVTCKWWIHGLYWHKCKFIVFVFIVNT